MSLRRRQRRTRANATGRRTTSPRGCAFSSCLFDFSSSLHETLGCVEIHLAVRVPRIDRRDPVQGWLVGFVKHLLQAALFRVDIGSVHNLEFETSELRIASMLLPPSYEVVRSAGPHHLARVAVAQDI